MSKSVERFVRGDVVFEDMGGETVMFDLTSRRLTTLNAAGRILWDALEHPSTLDQLQAVLAERFGLDAERAAADAGAFVSALRARGLIALAP